MGCAASHAAICEGMKGYDVRAALPSIEGEVLVMQGELDLMSPPAEGAHIARSIPNALHVQLDGSSHLSNVDQAAAFNSILLRFLNRASRRVPDARDLGEQNSCDGNLGGA